VTAAPVEFLCMVPKTDGYPTDWLDESADDRQRD